MNAVQQVQVLFRTTELLKILKKLPLHKSNHGVSIVDFQYHPIFLHPVVNCIALQLDIGPWTLEHPKISRKLHDKINLN